MAEDSVPQFVLEGLLEVRDSGAINMFNRSGVIDILTMTEFDDAADWLIHHKDQYMNALNAMGKMVTAREKHA